MTITTDMLSQAFGGFAGINKNTTPATRELDLHAVTKSVIGSLADMANPEGEDTPEERLAKLEGEVEEIEALLAKAEQGADGKVTVAVEEGDEIAKRFEVQTEEEPEGEETTVTKGADSEEGSEWDADMSPTRPPVMRAERLTKSERPVPARRRGRSAQEKYQAARERAMARRAGYDPRSLS